MHPKATVKDIPISLYTELVSRNHTYLYSMLLHDFKGHLSSISINLELLKETLPVESIQIPDMDIVTTTKQSIESIEVEIENIRLFMQSLLSSVEIPRLSSSPINLAEIVRSAKNFVGSEIKRQQIKVDIRSIPDEKAVILGDQKVMEQVFLNIVLHMLKPKSKTSNAIDISLTATDSQIQVAFTKESPTDIPPQQNGFFQDQLLVKTGNGINFLDLALQAHGGSLNLVTRPGHKTYTVSLPAIG